MPSPTQLPAELLIYLFLFRHVSSERIGAARGDIRALHSPTAACRQLRRARIQAPFSQLTGGKGALVLVGHARSEGGTGIFRHRHLVKDRVR